MHRFVSQALPTLEPHKFDQERQGPYIAAEPSDELGRRPRRPAGRQQIVHDEHPLPTMHSVIMHFERVRAVFERVHLSNAL